MLVYLGCHRCSDAFSGALHTKQDKTAHGTAAITKAVCLQFTPERVCIMVAGFSAVLDRGDEDYQATAVWEWSGALGALFGGSEMGHGLAVQSSVER